MKEEIAMALSRARVYVVPSMSFPAVMVLLWNYLILTQFYLIGPASSLVGNLEAIFYGCYTLFPFIGLLTDVYVGRYRAITTGIILCFISWIILGIFFIMNNCYEFMGKMWIIPGYIINNIGIVTFKANVIQYSIDQLIGGSANELSTIIYWNIAAYPVAWVLYDSILLYFNPVTTEKVAIIIVASGVALSLVLVSHSLFKHKLENISLIKNPIKLIVRVLCYARKHKYPENRSALTYWEEEAPSRLDLGKDKYGGPFTEEEVEDVKTFFRMLPLILIATFEVTSILLHIWVPRGDHIKKYSIDLHSLMFEDYGTYHITVLLLFFIYQFIIRGCFHKYIPSMLTRMGAGIAFALLGCITQVLAQKFLLYDFLLLVEQVLTGTSCFLILPTSLEFTVAQSPEYMRGIMVGLCYFSFGIGYSCAFMLSHFVKTWYYYIIVCVLQLLILMVFVILARRYKYRVRENEVNIVQIVDDHYQRYMEQEDEYERHQEIPESEIIIIED
uniref:Major facilitator superfamily (MFS) profile domain-containing protein n=2 Tax=Amphimedon queenslandica TaxID=400682 RepID=A0A1X7T9I8_AMPQE